MRVRDTVLVLTLVTPACSCPAPPPPPVPIAEQPAQVASTKPDSGETPRVVSAGPGTVAWAVPIGLPHVDYGGFVRVGSGVVVVAQSLEGRDASDLGVEGDAERLYLEAFGEGGAHLWEATVREKLDTEVSAMEIAPDGSTWVMGQSRRKSEDEGVTYSASVVRVDRAGKVVLHKTFPGEIHSHGIAFGPDGRTAIVFVRSAREQPGKAELTAPSTVVVVFDADSKQLAEWKVRAEAAEVVFDKAGTLHVQAQLDDSTVKIADENVKGPGVVMIKMSAAFAPEKVTRLARFADATISGEPYTFYDLERERDPARGGQLTASADILRRDAVLSEQWRRRVCERDCYSYDLRANARGDVLYSTANLPNLHRVMSLDAAGKVRFVLEGNCVRQADIAPDGRVAVLGQGCAQGEIVLGDHVLPAAHARGYVAVLRP